MSRPRISSCGTDKLKLHHYPEIVGITIFIFGKTFADFDGATRDCFGAFSVGTGEVVRGRLDDCVTVATPLPRSTAGSWTSFERLSERGGTTSSSSPLLPPHLSHHPRHHRQHPNPTPPGFRPHFLPPPQSALALHWASSTTQWWPDRQQNKTKVNRPICSEAE